MWINQVLLGRLRLIFVLLCSIGLTQISAQTPIHQKCYLVGDDPLSNTTGGTDDFACDALSELYYGTAVEVGLCPELPTKTVEAIEYQPYEGELYAADAAYFIRIDILNCTVDTIGAFGSATGYEVNPFSGAGSSVTITLDDVDGLVYDPINDIWYGVDRVGGIQALPEDRLFIFDPLTGMVIPGQFPDLDGDGVLDDFVSIESIPTGTTTLADVDDIGINPFTGDIYGIFNYGNGSSTYIAIIDPADGSTNSACQVTYNGNILRDVEGLSIDLMGRILVTTGELGGDASCPPSPPNPGCLANTLFEINPQTCEATLLSALPFAGDYEAFTCMTFMNPSSIGNFVWCDKNEDGVQDVGEPGLAGVGIDVYYDANGNGVAEASELIAQDTTDNTGQYLITGLAPLDQVSGSYIVVVDNTTVPTGSTQTTNPVNAGSDGGNQSSPYTISSLTYSEQNLTADFGFTCDLPACNLELVLHGCGPESSFVQETGGDGVMWDFGLGNRDWDSWPFRDPGMYSVTVTDANGGQCSCSIEIPEVECELDLCPDPAPAPSCSEGSFEWADDSGVGQVWNVDDSLNMYTVNLPSGPVGVGVTLLDPDNRNADNNQYTTHPFDPAGGCEPYPGAVGSTEVDQVVGDGSIIDPWDSDCNYSYTRTSGVFGSDYLTFTINSFDHTEEVTLEFSFDQAILLNDFCVSDIDFSGLFYAQQIGDPEYEDPGNSYQDEVILRATSACGDPVSLAICGGENLLIKGDTIRAGYTMGQTGDTDPDDLANTACVSSNVPLTSFTLTYSNGIADAAAEQLFPQLYEWWSNANGATNGVSDDQAIRVDGFDFCSCPEITAQLTSTELCNNASSTIAIESLSGGTGPYSYTWPDGSSASTYDVNVTADTTISLIVTDAACCIDTIPMNFTTISCCPTVDCLEITVTKN